MRRYVIFGTVSFGALLSSVTIYAASVALSLMVTDLNTTLILAGWVLSMYSLAYTIAMPLVGKMSETFGRKTTFVISTLLFTVGSVLCALSPNVYVLIGARAIQAIGGGGFMPSAAGIASDEFPGERQRYIGLLSSIVPIGMIIGPNIGGWLAEVFGWRSIFWFTGILGAIVLLVSQFLLSKEKRERTRVNIDYSGAGLLFGAIFALVFGLTEFGGNITSRSVWLFTGLLLIVAAVLFIIFLRRERHLKEPIIDLQLLRSRPFMSANAYNLLYGLCTIGVLSLIPLYATSIYHMSVLESGVLLTPRSLGMIVLSAITSFYLARWGYRWPMLIGTFILLVSFILLAFEAQGITFMGIHVGASAWLFAIIALCGIGSGISNPPSSNACIELMPDKVTTIAGLRGMFRNLGSAVGVAISTIFLHAISDIHQAFYVLLVASVVITVISIPTVFGMPASAKVSNPPS